MRIYIVKNYLASLLRNFWCEKLSKDQLINKVYYLRLESFSHQFEQMVFHWSLSGSKSPQVTWTLLSFLAVHNNAVV